MKEQFKEISFSKESRERIDQANEILAEYRGMRLTLRQLYYQFVSRDIIPNTERSYKNLGNVISKGRLAGLIDWRAIEDRMREPNSPPEFESIEDLVRGAMGAYRLPRRRGQEYYVELWVEKDALAGVLLPIARKHHVTLMVNRGYSSSSAMYESASRIHDERVNNRSAAAVILYLGDMDPSGEDMVRDVEDRLSLFGTRVDIRKLALTMEQVEEYEPPPNPAKLTDSRAKGYIEKYGDSSWEVDALPPRTLNDVIEAEIMDLTDESLVEEWLEKEKADKLRLEEAVSKLKS